VPLDDGSLFKLAPPVGEELPTKGYDAGESGYAAPTDDPASVPVAVDPKSERLALLEPFAPVDKQSGYQDLPVLLKDRASAPPTIFPRPDRGSSPRSSGPDQRQYVYRRQQRFTDKPGIGFNLLTGQAGETLPAIARVYKAKGLGWVSVGDKNYGEGSSREHAAMSPRFLGCRVVLTRSFARIHETNLKKQGICR